MSKLKALAGQTAIYGVSTILGRLLNFALIPIFSHLLPETKDLGYVNSLYGFIALLAVLATLGMETTFFYYSNKESSTKVYNNAFTVVFSASGILSLSIFLLAPWIDDIQLTHNPAYYRLIAGILLFDALVVLPFARMRNQNKAKKFALLKFLSIIINVSLSLGFQYACHIAESNAQWAQYFHSEDRVYYIFLATFLASFITFLLIIKEYKGLKLGFDGRLLNNMFRFSWPLIVVGIAAWINENMDKSLLDKLVPADGDEGYSQTGIYGAVYKLSIAMALVVQAFKFAAEPFFFSIQRDSDAKETYALVLKWFVIVQCLVFLGVSLNLELILLVLDEKYRIGKNVVPIVLLGQMFLGIYYNLSIWYKLTEKTIYGLYMSLIGAAVTVFMLFTFVPEVGYIGAAWATFASFFVMMITSFVLGKKHFPIDYDYGRIALYMVIALVFWLLFYGAEIEGLGQQVALGNSLIVFYLAFVWAIEKPRKLLLLRK